jgi:hypothetical protein
MLKEDRQRKAVRYQRYDPNKIFKAGSYYDELLDELPSHVFDAEGLLNKLKESDECKPRKTPRLS